MVLSNRGLKDVPAVRYEGRQCARFVNLHHTAIADHISREDSGEAAAREVFRHLQRRPYAALQDIVGGSD